MRFLTLALAGLTLATASMPATAATVAVPGDYPTIQAAIDGAPAGSTVQIAPGTYVEVLTLSQVTKGLTLRGDPDDPSRVVIDGGGVAGATVTMIDCASDVVLEGLTITGGRGSDLLSGGLFLANSDSVFRKVVFEGNSTPRDGGGAFILSSGGYFEDCVFRNNSSGRFGGGLVMNVGATTVFQRCQFVENESGTTDDIEGWGGGLHINDSTPTLIGCVIARNRAKFAGGGLAVTGHYNVPENHVTLRDCEIADNQALRGPDVLFTGGGGMHIEDNVHLLLDRCHVHDNVAGDGGGLSAFRAVYEIVDSLIEDNQAVATTPDVAGGHGGGVAATSVNTTAPTQRASSVTVRRSVIRNNTAHVAGGVLVQGDFGGLTSNEAALVLEDSLVAGNVAAGRAGGLFIDRTVAAVRRSHLIGNQVTSSNDSWGGGVASVGSSTTLIEDSALCGNSVAELGGGIYADQGGTITVANSRLAGNVAATGSGLGGGAMAVAAASGPLAGPVAGGVADSVLFANGGGPAIWESDCAPAMWSEVTYDDNLIRQPGGSVYFRNCSGFSPTVASFNAVGGKASGNVDQAPSFADFLAAPATVTPGRPSVLSWCVPDETDFAIDPGVPSLGAPAGTADVQPGATTTYTLTENGMATETGTVTVECASLGPPIPYAPAQGRGRQRSELVTLAWYEVAGAASYDVYLDAAAEPTTLVGSDLTEPTIALSGLASSTTYRWKVVAKSPACTTPVTSPVFSFSTCSGSVCFSDDFEDGDVSDWSVLGKGLSEGKSGRMRLQARRAMTVLSPVASVGDGTIAAGIEFRAGRRDLRVVFAREGATRYRQLRLKGNGRLRLEERRDGRTRGIALARVVLPASAFRLSLASIAGAVTVSIDGTSVLTGAYADARSGMVGVQVKGTTLTLDDVQIDGTP